jgi:protein-S-isoprenylcysteine O-methyltransferase Ste14
LGGGGCDVRNYRSPQQRELSGGVFQPHLGGKALSLVSRWVDLVHQVATGGWRMKLLLAPIASLLYLCLIVFFIMASLVVDRWLGFPKALFYPLSSIIGFCIIAFGLFLTLLSVAYFLRVKGTPVPLSPPPRLVAAGPYRFARNPMLTGIFIQLIGMAVALGSLSLAFIFTPLFIIINVWELKKIEEPELTRRFGQAYVEYRKRVPMFFPFSRKTRQ